MYIDAAILSPVSALLGALIGGGASVCAAVYTQRYQNRLQHISGEIAKRETVYADFVMNASNLLLNAYVHDDIALGGEEQRLIGLINRMRLFASPDVVKGAEAVVKAIVEISLKPSIEVRAPRERSVVRKPRSRRASVIQPDLPCGPGQRPQDRSVEPITYGAGPAGPVARRRLALTARRKAGVFLPLFCSCNA